MGRPALHTPELAKKILERLADGESLRSICMDEDMPGRTTVVKWVTDNTEEFATQYAHAKSIGLDVMAEDTLVIADTPEEGVKQTDKLGKAGPYTEVSRGDMTEHRKLRVETRKWYLGKLAPKLYGANSTVALTGADGGPIVLDDHTRAAKINALFAAAARIRDNCEDLV